jgi:UDP-3-O-[3-hydroxymyristoyl] glucosamine N-acyltransferase
VGEGTEVEDLKDRNLVLVKNPSQAYLKIAKLFYAPREKAKGIHPLATVSDRASVADGAAVSAYACIEEGAVIERDVTIYPFAYIGANVKIGEGTVIYPHVTIYDGTVIGKRVTVHGGTVLGADGFGYIWDGKGHAKIPQLGFLEIGDDVEIGANTTIDRASLGKTFIGKGVKIDNLVQIAHNVSIGDNSVIVSQVGIAGSVVIGKNVVLAGQAGVKDHVTIGDNVKAGGGTGITSSVAENSLIMGTPHMAFREWAKLQSYLKRLPKLFDKMKRIEKKLHLEVENDRDQ